jgi:hypothetical protein
MTLTNRSFAAAFVVIGALSAASPAAADIRRPVRYQFQQVLLPTGDPQDYRVGLWTLDPGTGRVRLCVADDAAKGPVMECSEWTSAGPQGHYRLMQMRVRRRRGMPVQAGVWVINYRTGNVRACLIGDPDKPAASLRCSEMR